MKPASHSEDISGLPEVLLLGDSISIGYSAPVGEAGSKGIKYGIIRWHRR